MALLGISGMELAHKMTPFRKNPKDEIYKKEGKCGRKKTTELQVLQSEETAQTIYMLSW